MSDRNSPGTAASLKSLLPYLWPAGEPELKARVVLASVALVIAKVANVYVPVIFKHLIDGLGKPGAMAALPLGLLAAYGLARIASQAFAELRDGIFAKVAQRAIRAVALDTFRHLHALSLKFHLDRQTGGLSRAIERGAKGIEFLLFFVLWLGEYFQLDLMRPIDALFSSIYAFANAGFYFTYFVMVAILLMLVYVTRWLDFWEVLPNEILHHHGPLSDLERFPTMNLKFDKEIPDILEYLILRSGRLVLHVGNERKSIVLDNVLWIDRKEERLKKLMSRLEVRITSDQEASEPI